MSPISASRLRNFQQNVNLLGSLYGRHENGQTLPCYHSVVMLVARITEKSMKLSILTVRTDSMCGKANYKYQKWRLLGCYAMWLL
jgi:hypothetical protein